MDCWRAVSSIFISNFTFENDRVIAVLETLSFWRSEVSANFVTFDSWSFIAKEGVGFAWS